MDMIFPQSPPRQINTLLSVATGHMTDGLECRLVPQTGRGLRVGCVCFFYLRRAEQSVQLVRQDTKVHEVKTTPLCELEHLS